MHTLMVMAGGWLLLFLCLLLARLSNLTSQATAALAFVPLWLLLSISNMAVGIHTAGYTLAEEAPVFVLVFALPALSALWLWLRLRR